MTTQPQNYSDFIIFADESGDHGLENINLQFPVFALAFCVVRVDEYINSVVPEIQRLKFSTWGHDSVVLHEHDIRKSEKEFASFRADRQRRERFMDDLSAVMKRTQMGVIASVIDKNRLTGEYIRSKNPYEISLMLCMERLLDTLINQNQLGKLVHVIFESRGKNEDRDLEAEFRQICANQDNWGYRSRDFFRMRFEPVFVSKAANSVGLLQLADLVARPIALRVIRPDQANRAYDIIEPKIWDLKKFP